MHACIGEGNGNRSSILDWRNPGTEKPGGLPSMGLHRVGHDGSDLAAAAAACTATRENSHTAVKEPAHHNGDLVQPK